jgi:hypothetical protein
MIRPAMAPRIPPMMAPVFVDLVVSLVGALVGVLVVETERMLVGLFRLTSEVVDDAEVVCTVFELVRLVVSEVLVEVDVLKCEDIEVDIEVDIDVDVVESLSGHTPVVQGSLEQHPRKFPALQTYHSLVPVQLLETRGESNSITEGDVKTRVGSKE